MNMFYADKEKMPKRATMNSAGYDFVLPHDVYLPAGERVLIDSGVKVLLDDDKYLALHIRSSLGKEGIILTNCTGIIDADYYNTGNNIKGMLWNTSDTDVTLYKGERYMQGIICKYYKVDNDVVKDKRLGGLGSTGK